MDSPYSSVQGADVMTASIEAQQLAIVGLRRGWLAPMKVALDATGRLSDVARCHRLSRLLEVNQEALSIEEELKKYLVSAANQRLGADLKMAMDSILKVSIYQCFARVYDAYNKVGTEISKSVYNRYVN